MPTMTDPRLLSWVPEDQLEPQTREQASQLAQMPFIFKHVALMPDCHLGKGATVGSCIPTQGAIIPAAVGVDIGCGMIAVQTPLSRTDLPEDLSPIREAIEQAVPLSAGHYNDRITDTAAPRVKRLEEMARETSSLAQYDQIDPNWTRQMGSLGSGNHFIEVTLDEQDRVWTFLHSGSRGIGNRLAQWHIRKALALCTQWFVNLPNPDLAYLPEDTPEFDHYLQDLQWAQEFALLNRAEMTDRVLAVLQAHAGNFQEEQRIECHHNFTQREHHFHRDILVSRKGAIQARKGQLGLIPGSMGTRSYVVRGRGNKASFNTAPHGAGRRLSRSQARKSFTMQDFDHDMRGIEARRSHHFLDELPGAYKDIDTVMDQSKDLVEVIHTFRQIVNVKGD